MRYDTDANKFIHSWNLVEKAAVFVRLQQNVEFKFLQSVWCLSWAKTTLKCIETAFLHSHTRAHTHIHTHLLSCGLIPHIFS